MICIFFCPVKDLSFFEKQFIAYRGKILSFFKARAAFEDAEELSQETYLRAFKSIEKFDSSKGEFGSWLFAIARNVFIKHKSKDYLTEADMESSLIPDRYSLENEFQKKSLTETVKLCISCLPEPEKGILISKYKYNKSLEEIGAEFGISARTVSRKYLEALNLLKEELRKKGVDGNE